LNGQQGIQSKELLTRLPLEVILKLIKRIRHSGISSLSDYIKMESCFPMNDVLIWLVDLVDLLKLSSAFYLIYQECQLYNSTIHCIIYIFSWVESYLIYPILHHFSFYTHTFITIDQLLSLSHSVVIWTTISSFSSNLL